MKWFKRIAIVLAVLLFVPLIALLAMGQRAGAGKMETSAELNAPVEQVWTWIDDGNKLKQWVSWLVDVQSSDPSAFGLGASRVYVMKDENNGGEMMRITGKCSEYVRPTRMTVHLSDAGGSFNGDQTYQLVDLGNGRTRLDVHFTFHFGQWFANLMEPVITPQAEKKMVGDLARLKSLVETHAALR